MKRGIYERQQREAAWVIWSLVAAGTALLVGPIVLAVALAVLP